ncbi:MAG: phosphate ABC transporter permease PstA [Candidatus Bipolaricaulota bacterium]|nr:phosphate ABC transporter permease PstA [Candidatus Bipolaricaulota bacterium]MBS3792511.1 phosphate ABC transporter permease PstA [Candidatus Bipolaricaulota bacterium]
MNSKSVSEGKVSRWEGRLFYILCFLATLFGIGALATLLVYVFWDSIGWVDWQFITSSPSRFPAQAGIYPALMGSVFVIALVALFSLPLGVGAAIYLEEYAPRNTLTRIIEINIANLAGVPSIVYGLLGLAMFLTLFNLEDGTVFVGSLTLTLLILPIVIISAKEAIKSVPDSHKHAAYGVGATQWQMIRSVVLPEAAPGIMTGLILALARAIGETAPLIMIGAATSIYSAPRGIFDMFSGMPLQIFAWSDLPSPDFQHGVTPAGVVVLLSILLLMNSIAVFIRYRFQRGE